MLRVPIDGLGPGEEGGQLRIDGIRYGGALGLVDAAPGMVQTVVGKDHHAAGIRSLGTGVEELLPAHDAQNGRTLADDLVLLPSFHHGGEALVPGRAVVNGLPGLLVQGRIFQAPDAFAQDVVRHGNGAGVVIKARVRPEDVVLVVPVARDGADGLLAGAPVADDDLPRGHLPFRAFHLPLPAFQTGRAHALHIAAAVPAVGRVMRLPERVIDGEDLAVQRPVLGPGAGVLHRDIAQIRLLLPVVPLFFPGPGVVGALHILAGDEAQAPLAALLHLDDLARARVDLITRPPPALGAQHGLQRPHEPLLAFPFLQHCADAQLQVAQHVQFGAVGYGEGRGMGLLPHAVPVERDAAALAPEIGHGLFRRQSQDIGQINGFLLHGCVLPVVPRTAGGTGCPSAVWRP